MAKFKEICKCKVCENIAEVLHEGAGPLYCCGEIMEEMKEKTDDMAQEKHVPYIKRTDDGFLVKIGLNQEHPMEEKHYIEWIELSADGITHRKFLNPGDKPKTLFKVKAENVNAREYCNVHGLWKS